MATVASSTRPFFGSVDTSGDDQPLRDDVESPSLSSSNALARFEFEPGRTSKDGTKVLMVEWEDDETTKEIAGDWEISWEGKRTTLPARDPKPSPSVAAVASSPPPSDLGGSSSSSGEQPVNRLYFLLGPGVPVPTAVRLQKGEVTWRTNPLPAIFAPELGATARQAGKKGVLHTVWAKKRLQVLQHEIEHESKNNAEGIGLQMAVTEKEWIEQNFGVVARPGSSSSGGPNIVIPSSAGPLPHLNSPTSPRSPGGGRLMDKLKGLKLSTSNGVAAGEHNPLSPESSDVAVSGFSSFAALKGDAAAAGAALPSLAAKPAQPPAAPAKRMVAAPRPPDTGKWQPQQGMGSLNAFASGDVPGGFSASAPPPNPAAGNKGADDDDDDDDDLFALPMSPRSPEMTKSPFSFAQQDSIHASIDGRTG